MGKRGRRPSRGGGFNNSSTSSYTSYQERNRLVYLVYITDNQRLVCILLTSVYRSTATRLVRSITIDERDGVRVGPMGGATTTRQLHYCKAAATAHRLTSSDISRVG